MSIEMVQKVRKLEAEVKELKQQLEDLRTALSPPKRAVAFDEFEDMADVG